MAGCNDGLNVFVNDLQVPVQNFRQYVQQIFVASCPEEVRQHDSMQQLMESLKPDEETTTTETGKKRRTKEKHWTDEHIAYYEPNAFWSVAVFGSELKEYQQISFVNSIFTSDGGSHVEIVLDNLIEPINDKVKDYVKK